MFKKLSAFAAALYMIVSSFALEIDIQEVKNTKEAAPGYSLFKTFNTYIKDEAEYSDRLKAAFKTGYKLFFAKTKEGNIVGMVGFSTPRELYWSKYMHMDVLVVDEKERRKKIATKLVNFVKEIADKEKVTKLSWETGTAREDAKAFYKALGYETAALEYRYYPPKK